MTLNYYIDSADRREVVDLLATGLFRGVTTNPATDPMAEDMPGVTCGALAA